MRALARAALLLTPFAAVDEAAAPADRGAADTTQGAP